MVFSRCAHMWFSVGGAFREFPWLPGSSERSQRFSKTVSDIYMYIYLSIHIHMYIYIYTHTHIFTLNYQKIMYSSNLHISMMPCSNLSKVVDWMNRNKTNEADINDIITYITYYPPGFLHF